MAQQRIQVKLYHPEPYQQAVLDGLMAHWEDSLHMVKAVRQCGKSMMLENLLIRVSLQHPNQTSVLISPTFKQGKKIFKSILKKFRRTPLYGSSNAQDGEFTFSNGSTISFLSAAQGENIRGETVSKYGVLAIDEAAYIPDEIYYTASPFTNANHPPTVCVSTPRFRAGFFYDFYQDGLNNMPGVYSYDFTDYPNPYITPAKLDMYRRRMPINLFRADYLGEWMEATSDLFGDFSQVMSNTVALDGGEITAGLDWGVGKDAKGDSDYTSLSLFNERKQQVRLYHWNDLDETATIDAIVEAIRVNGIKKMTVELNGIGQVYLGLLKKAISREGLPCRVVEFNTSNDSKRRIIEQFIVDVQNRTVQLLDGVDMKIQMSAYQMQRLPSGRITYNAAPGYHDDCIMATAFALYGQRKANFAVR